MERPELKLSRDCPRRGTRSKFYKQNSQLLKMPQFHKLQAKYKCLQFGQIHLAVFTNTLVNLDKYILQKIIESYFILNMTQSFYYILHILKIKFCYCEEETDYISDNRLVFCVKGQS